MAAVAEAAPNLDLRGVIVLFSGSFVGELRRMASPAFGNLNESAGLSETDAIHHAITIAATKLIKAVDSTRIEQVSLIRTKKVLIRAQAD